MERAINAPHAVIAAKPRRSLRLSDVNFAMLLWIALTVVTVGAYGLWAYLGTVRSGQRAVAAAALFQAQVEGRDLQHVLADKPSSESRYLRLLNDLSTRQERLVRSPERVMVVEAMVGLAERIGAPVMMMTVGESKMAKVKDQQFELLQTTLMVSGANERILELVDALQSGMLSGLTVIRYETVEEEVGVTATLTLGIYTLPSADRRDDLPPTLYAVGPAINAIAPASIPSDTITPLLTWYVQGPHLWAEAFRGATFNYRGSVVGELQVYAETTGDNLLQPGWDELVARARPAAGGKVVLTPTTPHRFASDSGRKFYIAIDTSGSGSSNDVEVAVLPHSIAFTSTLWPPVDALTAITFSVDQALPRPEPPEPPTLPAPGILVN